MTCIYVLRDPATRQIRYVGQTYRVEQRKKAHTVNPSRKSTTAVTRWCCQMVDAGTPPIFEPVVLVAIAETPDGCRNHRMEGDVNAVLTSESGNAGLIERSLIQRCRMMGIPLLNHKSTAVKVVA